MPKLTKLEAGMVVEVLGAVVDNLIWDGSTFTLSTDFQVTLSRSARTALTRVIKKMRLWEIEPGLLTCQESLLMFDTLLVVDWQPIFSVKDRLYVAQWSGPFSMSVEDKAVLSRLLGKVSTWTK